MDELLPDKWHEVVKARTRKLYFEGLRNLRIRKTMLEECEECPMLKTEVFDGYHETWIFTICRVYGNKCIKQYPHRIDNERFI